MKAEAFISQCRMYLRKEFRDHIGVKETDTLTIEDVEINGEPVLILKKRGRKLWRSI